MIVCADNMDPERGLPSLADASVDAIVTDPPAGIAFMGKGWDSDKGGRDQWIAWLAGVMCECLRVLKPGGHALVWALPRTSHWTATAVEDAGFEVRDVVCHLFGTGFPKSLDVSKAIDKAAGAERTTTGSHTSTLPGGNTFAQDAWSKAARETPGARRDMPATEDAAQWSGWGTALKPAAEHWILARKPLGGTVANCVLKHGTGALNIDGTRISTTDSLNGGAYSGDARKATSATAFVHRGIGEFVQPLGRWPANVTLDEEAADVLGSPSRFYFVAKSSRAEKTHGGTVDNKHPTVKSIALMRWLVRLITPPGGLVLDPFAGSGTTGVAALAEGMRFMGMERDEQYAEIAAARLRQTEAT